MNCAFTGSLTVRGTELTEWYEAPPHMVAAHWPVQLNQRSILRHILFLPTLLPLTINQLPNYDFNLSDEKTHHEYLFFQYWVKRLRKWHWSSVKGHCGFVSNSALLYCVNSSLLPSEPSSQTRVFCLTGRRQRCAVILTAKPADVSDADCLFLTLGWY